MRSPDKKLERLVTCARMYYEQNMTQNEIAKALGVSRPLVSVLLSEARQKGIVTITIHAAGSVEELAAAQLKQRFSLRQVLVVPDGKSAEETNNAVAAAVWDLCFARCTGGSVGLGWGSMLGRMADYADTLPDAKAPLPGRILPLIGGIGGSYRGYHTNELARVFSSKIGMPADYLYLPAFFDSEAEARFARGLDSTKAIESKWADMDLAIVNISNYLSYPDLGVEYRFGSRLAQNGAVGRVLAHYYDRQGRIIEPAVDNGLQSSIAQLSSAKSTVAVCSTLLRPEAVVGFLRLVAAQTLCLPHSLAERVLSFEG